MRDHSDTSDLLDTLSHFAASARDRYGIEGAWLFGSWATGSAGNESDIDLALILRDEPEFDVEIDLALEAKDVDSAIEALVMSRERFDHGRMSVIEEIKEHGIRVL